MQKVYRLSKSSAFNYIYRKGQSYACKHLVLLFAPTKFSLKVGFSVSKKIGKSVVRNKTKRRLKEAFRSLIEYVDKGHNYVIVARSASAEADYHALRASLIYVLTKTGLIDTARRCEYEEQKAVARIDTLLQDKSQSFDAE